MLSCGVAACQAAWLLRLQARDSPTDRGGCAGEANCKVRSGMFVSLVIYYEWQILNSVNFK